MSFTEFFISFATNQLWFLFLIKSDLELCSPLRFIKSFCNFNFHNNAFYFNKHWLITCFVSVSLPGTRKCKDKEVKKAVLKYPEFKKKDKCINGLLCYKGCDKDMGIIICEHRWGQVTLQDHTIGMQ